MAEGRGHPAQREMLAYRRIPLERALDAYKERLAVVTIKRGGELESEVVQFILALVLFAIILIGSYWFVYMPTRRRARQENEKETSRR